MDFKSKARMQLKELKFHDMSGCSEPEARLYIKSNNGELTIQTCFREDIEKISGCFLELHKKIENLKKIILSECYGEMNIEMSLNLQCNRARIGEIPIGSQSGRDSWNFSETAGSGNKKNISQLGSWDDDELDEDTKSGRYSMSSLPSPLSCESSDDELESMQGRELQSSTLGFMSQIRVPYKKYLTKKNYTKKRINQRRSSAPGDLKRGPIVVASGSLSESEIDTMGETEEVEKLSLRREITDEEEMEVKEETPSPTYSRKEFSTSIHYPDDLEKKFSVTFSVEIFKSDTTLDNLHKMEVRDVTLNFDGSIVLWLSLDEMERLKSTMNGIG
jgi:hypothetical protein